MVNFAPQQSDALQQFYNSFRIPQQGQTQPGPQAPQMSIPQLTPAKQSVNPAGQLNQMIEQGRGGDNTQNYAASGTAPQGGPLTQYIANAMTSAGNNSAMTSMGGFNNPGAQVGLNNINWGAPAAAGAAGGAADGAAAAGGGGIMSMLAALL